MNKENILLFGGTAETKEITQAILEKGCHLTISTASNDTLGIETNINITRKVGMMNESEIITYLRRHLFTTVICAVHPYAHAARTNIINACEKSSTRILTYLRKDTELENLSKTLDISYAQDHTEAATIANKRAGNILLTTGSRNLAPYMNGISESTTRIYARVLNCPESKSSLELAGIKMSHSILARGPFTISQNIDLITKFNIKTLITKDGGSKGGTPEKLTAASQAYCHVILIARPPVSDLHYMTITALLENL